MQIFNQNNTKDAQYFKYTVHVREIGIIFRIRKLFRY